MPLDPMGFSKLDPTDTEWRPLPEALGGPTLNKATPHAPHALYDYTELLRGVGLRPTRQRLVLSFILFSKGNRHLTAEMLYAEAVAAKFPVSLATVYNNLHQFTQAGLVRQISVDGSKAHFDTNPTEHHHFFLTGEHALVDIPAGDVVLGALPTPPEGFEIARVDVLVRLRRKRASAK
jgi:Fur family transcriptional regulator, iron response regulator